MGQLRVFQAQPYRCQSMVLFGDASYMLIRQHDFPDTFDERDRYEQTDHDHCFQRDFNYAWSCFKRHTGEGELSFGHWAKGASDERIIAFIADILKADKDVKWTGYRIMGTVIRGIRPVWTLELFAKHSDSATKVYSDDTAPNVGQKYVSPPR